MASAPMHVDDDLHTYIVIAGADHPRFHLSQFLNEVEICVGQLGHTVGVPRITFWLSLFEAMDGNRTKICVGR